MSSFASTHSSPLGLNVASGPARGEYRRRPGGTRGLSALLLAAVVAAMVVLADQLISTWADDHLFMAWVLLWVVVFAGLALFAGTARSLAQRATVYLDSWSQSLAEARAQVRLWEAARQDPRLMSDLMAARSRGEAEQESQVTVAETAEQPALEESHWDRWAAFRSRQALLHRFI